MRGLLAPLERRNGWTLAERAGHVSPDGLQGMLCSAAWDRNAVRDDVRDYIVEAIGDAAGVLVADETGFVKIAHDRRGWVLARRSITDPGEIAYYVCFGPRGNEIRRLFAHLVLTVRHQTSHIPHWSDFRRRCQEQARVAHNRKRLEPP